ncbi:MAG: Mur ligase domain-containing protein, partial [Patescibacteria group bacterium]
MTKPKQSLDRVKNIYLLGIKGAGMTALAQVFKHQQKKVWGSDVADRFFTDDVLRREKIRVLPFSPKNITQQIDLLIYSTAYGRHNSPEFVRARKLKIPMLSYPEALGQLFAGHYGIAVCGTHGKTTTTGMLGYVLQELGQDPLVVVGSTVEQIGGNARVGQGKYFVVEADEYQNKLRHYTPQAVILTSADFDHPDYFKNQAAYTAVFKRFVRRIPKTGVLVAFTDD